MSKSRLRQILYFLLMVLFFTTSIYVSAKYHAVKNDLRYASNQICKLNEQINVQAERSLEIEQLLVEANDTIKYIKSTEYEFVYLGEFKLTAYCSCEKCCGYWATIRDTDENGEPIVYTASGAVAKDGVTIAVDTSQIPYGTDVYIAGYGFRSAQDCGGAIKGNRIDVYYSSHEEALAMGVVYKDVWALVKNS